MAEFLQTSDGLEIYDLNNFDIPQTLDCGQCFRWDNLGTRYKGIVSGRGIEAYQEGSKISLLGVSREEFEFFWADYFDIYTDYSKIAKTFSGMSPLMSKAVGECSGIRILKQDFWETLCSFIVSQNNNIPRIKKIINLLCTNFGEYSNGVYAFPSPEVLAGLSEEDLLVIRAGFRAKYIIDAAQKVALGIVNADDLRNTNIDEAVFTLMKIKGVGIKVAQCVMLYGLHDLSAFPVDVWMKRVMDKFFPGSTPEIFGRYAGVAQQYLYHYSRNHPEIFD